MTLALEGLRVVDVSQGVAGPLCSMVLADFGAEVVKVEPPGGDWLRQVGPFTGGESALFLRLNRGKRGLCVDLKRGEGKEIFTRLARRADVVVEGYRPGVMHRLGLSYEALSVANPALIYCSISGYGSAGPMAEMAASELDLQGLIGQFRRLGVPGEPPLRAGFDLVSTNAAWAACEAIIAALYVRGSTGEGQKVETSLLDAAVALMQFSFSAESDPDQWRSWPLSGYTEPPAHGFHCKDASFLLDLGRARGWWDVFCQAVGADHVLTDPRFETVETRRSNEGALIEELGPSLAQWTFADLVQLVQGMGGTIVRIHDAESLFHDPQVQALDLVKLLEHPAAGEYQTINLPWKFSVPIAELSKTPAPDLGEHNRQLLESLGYDGAQVATLMQLGVVGRSNRAAAAPHARAAS